MVSKSSTHPKRDAEWVALRVGAHRRVRVLGTVVITFIILLVLAGWLLLGSRIGDRRFDGRRYTVVDIIDGATLVIADEPRTRVALLGVDAPDWPDAHYSKESAGYLTDQLKTNVVLLKLDGTQTRNLEGRLLAYVYLTDTDLVNANVIRDGRGFSDRRFKHTYRQQFDQIENEARGKARGMWDEMTDDKMPAWRLEWLRSR